MEISGFIPLASILDMVPGKHVIYRVRAIIISYGHLATLIDTLAPLPAAISEYLQSKPKI
jgi:hypothetical protein